jgi:hypothetical protein
MEMRALSQFISSRRSFLIEAIASLFILLFVYAALSKLYEIDSFQAVLKKSPLIGDRNVLVAWTIPNVEIVVALLLLLPHTRLMGLYGSLGLMSLFTLYLGYMLAFSRDLPCSCGGVISSMTWTQHLIFNIFFTLLAWAGIWLYRKRSWKAKEESQPVYA